jgi:RimJ/RimL family protein N-acetyltransferase
MQPEIKLSVREIENADIPLIINYWLSAKDSFLLEMGADPAKMLSLEDWKSMLGDQLSRSYKDKNSYCIIWLLNNEPVGHSNVNKIRFGTDAFLHLHLWKAELRNKGYGSEFIKLALPYFFQNLQLKTIYSEPFSLNPAPNKTLEKLGFQLEKKYRTTPGVLNFEQPAYRWVFHKDVVTPL